MPKPALKSIRLHLPASLVQQLVDGVARLLFGGAVLLSSNGMPRCRAETWIQARAAPGPERASPLRRDSPGLDSGPLGWPLFRYRTARSAPVLLFGANVALENRD